MVVRSSSVRRGLRLVIGHHALLLMLMGAIARRRSIRRTVLLLCGGVAFTVTYARGRATGRRQTAEHIARMRRLRPDVLNHFYISCIGSMEEELRDYPAYDQRKHELRYRLVADEVIRYAAEGATVVDVGCASALVLDRVRQARRTTGIGFDLAPRGLRDRRARPDAPVLAQAVVEDVPLRDRCADVVVFSEVVEHLIDAYRGIRETGRITRPGGVMVLTTNNASEMPTTSPLQDPLMWAERLAGRRWPQLLCFRNITWHLPINREADPLPDEAPTYAPHFHFALAELRALAEDAGFGLVSSQTFEFPAPQSLLAEVLRRLSAHRPRAGTAASDTLEAVASRLPGLRLMGTHHLLVFRRVAPPRERPSRPWWPAQLVSGRASVPPR